MANELFRIIAGYEGLYRVSDFGRIVGHSGRVLKPSTGSHGFKTVILCKNGIKSQKLLHRLIAETFIDNPSHFEDVDHKNFDKLDNRAENLEWVDDIINNRRLYDAGRMKGNYQSKWRIRCIETGVEFKSMLECATIMQLPYATINYCINDKMGMQHVRGYHFEKINNT